MKTINKQGRNIAIIAMMCIIAVFVSAEVSEAKTLQEVTTFADNGEVNLPMMVEVMANPESEVTSIPMLDGSIDTLDPEAASTKMLEETVESRGLTDHIEKIEGNLQSIEEYEETTYAVVSGEGVNFRVAPGTTSKIKDCLPKGNPLEVLSRKKLAGDSCEWCEVKNLNNGKIGFMYGKYVKEVSSIEKAKEKNKNTIREEKLITEKEGINRRKVAVKNPIRKKEETNSKKTKSSKASVKEMKEYAKQLCKEKYDWGNDQFKCLEKLWERESGWNPNCVYNGCYGIPQRKALPDRPVTKEFKENWKVQVKWGCEYIKLKYGKPSAALAHSDRTNWY